MPQSSVSAYVVLLMLASISGVGAQDSAEVEAALDVLRWSIECAEAPIQASADIVQRKSKTMHSDPDKGFGVTIVSTTNETNTTVISDLKVEEKVSASWGNISRADILSGSTVQVRCTEGHNCFQYWEDATESGYDCNKCWNNDGENCCYKWILVERINLSFCTPDAALDAADALNFIVESKK